MKSIILSKSIPVVDKYDVIICGGGPAGWIAAVTAVRNGARTALIERYGFLGGAHPVDIHRAVSTLQDVQFLNKEGNIPYRSLYSDKVPNLPVAGRSLSADEVASASVRVQASCMAVRQDADTAAALCCDNECAVNELSINLLRVTLINQHAIV